MQIIFVNLQCNAFIIKPLMYYLEGRPCTYKHLYLLKYLLRENKDVAVYINKEGSSINFIKKHFKYKYIRELEFYITMILNGINPFQITIINDYRDIKKDDLVFGYTHYLDQINEMNKYDAIKLVHLNHFHSHINDSVKLLSRSHLQGVIAEANLKTDSILFQHSYNILNCPFFVLPYTFQKRFQKNVPFKSRKNKAVATGTYAFFDEKEFVDLYKVNYLQPLRKEIDDNKEYLTPYIDSYIHDYCQSTNQVKEIAWLPGWLKNLGILRVKKDKYYSFDMVEKYNEYKMSVISEEITGLPAIGFVESMACGCAYIGIDHSMYHDLGLIPDVHYISYDGSLKDLKRKIAYYQLHQEEMEVIANNGYSFVRKNLNIYSVARKFFNEIEGKLQK